MKIFISICIFFALNSSLISQDTLFNRYYKSSALTEEKINVNQRFLPQIINDLIAINLGDKKKRQLNLSFNNSFEGIPLKIKEKLRKIWSTDTYKDLTFALIVSIAKQELYIINSNELIKKFPISSATLGTGNIKDSNKTPLGTHRIIEKFGEDMPKGAIFKERRFTGKIAQIIQEKVDIEKDYITSRILWLDGIENNNSNSKERYIYIHGTAEEGLIGQPASHGCIRMKNDDIIEIYDYLPILTLVEIFYDGE